MAAHLDTSLVFKEALTETGCLAVATVLSDAHALVAHIPDKQMVPALATIVHKAYATETDLCFTELWAVAKPFAIKIEACLLLCAFINAYGCDTPI